MHRAGNVFAVATRIKRHTLSEHPKEKAHENLRPVSSGVSDDGDRAEQHQRASGIEEKVVDVASSRPGRRRPLHGQPLAPVLWNWNSERDQPYACLVRFKRKLVFIIL